MAITVQCREVSDGDDKVGIFDKASDTSDQSLG